MRDGGACPARLIYKGMHFPYVLSAGFRRMHRIMGLREHRHTLAGHRTWRKEPCAGPHVTTGHWHRDGGSRITEGMRSAGAMSPRSASPWWPWQAAGCWWPCHSGQRSQQWLCHCGGHTESVAWPHRGTKGAAGRWVLRPGEERPQGEQGRAPTWLSPLRGNPPARGGPRGTSTMGWSTPS